MKRDFITEVRIYDPAIKDTRLVRVEVAVDVSAIAAELASRAFFSKSKKSKALHGAVVVRTSHVGSPS